MSGVFFSYTHQPNGKVLTALHEGFNAAIQEKVPGLKVFIDVAIAEGRRWREDIRDALTKSVIFVCVVEPSYWRSPFCRQELREALDRAALDPGFWVLPVFFQPVDTEVLDHEARMLYARMREIQGVDALSGVGGTFAATLAEVVKDLLEHRDNASASSRGPLAETFELFQKLGVDHDLDSLLFDSPRLRPLVSLLPRAPTPAEQLWALLQAIETKPEILLTLLYAVRRARVKRAAEVDVVLDLWRETERKQAARPRYDALAELRYHLMFDVEKILGRLSCDSRFSGIAVLVPPRELSLDKRSLWLVKLLESRQLLTLGVRDIIFEQLTTVDKSYENICAIFRHFSVPARRQRLIDLLLVVFQSDSLALHSWLDDGEDMRNVSCSVSGNEAPLDIARKIVEECELYGLLNERFFTRLLLFAPELRAEISACAAPWVSAVPSPEGQLWRDRLVMFWAALIESGRPAYYQIMTSLGVAPENLIDHFDVAPTWICRSALGLLESRGLLNRRLIHQLVEHYPRARHKLYEIELILLTEERSGPYVELPLTLPGPPSRSPNASWFDRAVFLLCDAFSTSSLRSLGNYFYHKNMHMHMPRSPTTPHELACAMVQRADEIGVLEELLRCASSKNPGRRDEFDQLIAERAGPEDNHSV